MHQRQPEKTPNVWVRGANGRGVSRGRFRVVGCGAFRLDFDGGLGGEAEETALFLPVMRQVFAQSQQPARRTISWTRLFSSTGGIASHRSESLRALRRAPSSAYASRSSGASVSLTSVLDDNNALSRSSTSASISPAGTRNPSPAKSGAET